MKKVTVNASRKYDVVIGQGILDSIGKTFFNMLFGSKVMIVSDDNVFPLYGERVRASLESEDFTVTEFIIPHGEHSKSLDSYTALLEALNAAHIERDDTVLALGGGVVGDLAGFAAATYQRGTGFVQVPTSLLACVDSSVGGKTAVNLTTAKNQVGCFYQPQLVLCDTDVLKTLPENEYRNGCAEIIKYGMITDSDLFELISKEPIKDNFEEIIYRCVSVKRDFVQEDEFDKGRRMMLNFGHTIGHAVEACSGYTVSHGEAVAIGMVAIAKSAVVHGYCTEETSDTLHKLIREYGLPDIVEYTADSLADAIISDKKNINGKIRLIVPQAIGKCIIKEIYRDDLVKWLCLGGAG